MISIAWSIGWAFLKANWKPFLVGAAILSVFVYHKVQVGLAWRQGRESIIIEQKAEAQRRDNDANAADAASRKCSGDPDCLMRDDGHRRD
jgi:hypothetical protein